MLCNLYWVYNNCTRSLTLSNRDKKCFAAPLRGATAPAGPPGSATACIASQEGEGGEEALRAPVRLEAAKEFGLVLVVYV